MRKTQPTVAGLEDAGKGHKPINAGGPRNWESKGTASSLYSLRKAL